ncbi:putative protein ImpF [Candidatus Paraburkholderia schumanniana]|nr:putative protein ImpF [Candidatus Paraburkholderia schumannianae]
MKIIHSQGPRSFHSTVPRRADARLLPTIIDRLRDDAPQCKREAPGEYTVSRAQLREIIQRDLAYLLNCTSIDEQIDRTCYPEAATSTLNFGVPSLTGAYMASRNWAEIERVIRRALHDFEPRLIADSFSVRLTNGAANNDHYNNLTFEIRGMIRIDPYPMEITVQSTLDLETSRMHTAARRSRQADL